jgi:hypothetical protein
VGRVNQANLGVWNCSAIAIEDIALNAAALGKLPVGVAHKEHEGKHD